MSNHDDPVEYTGVNAGVKAEPPAFAREGGLKKPGSHPKIAIQRPKREAAAAAQDLAEARVELQSATSVALAAVRAEGEAMAAFIVANKPNQPTYDQINRERLTKEQAALIARKAAGEPLQPAMVYKGDQSPLSLAALARGRRPTTPLRSTTVRRVG